MKMGANRLSLGNETHLRGSEKRRHVQCQRKRICGEMVPQEAARSSQVPDTKPIFWPPLPLEQGAAGHSPYLLRSDHGDHVGSLLPHHLPEVMARVRQGPLRGDVVPFGPANHHLQTKESIGEAAPNPGPSYLLTTGGHMALCQHQNP